MIKNIDHICIVVSNLNETKTFFKYFGFLVEDEALLEGKWISEIVGLEDVRANYALLSLPGSETGLHMIQYLNPSSEPDPNINRANQIGFRHLAFRVDNIEKMVSELKDRGVQFFSDIQVFTKKKKKVVYFPGPDGIILEFTEYD